MADSVETLGVDLRTRESEEEKVQCKVLNHKEEYSISKALHEYWCQEVVTCRYDASKDLGSPYGWDVSH